MNAERHKYSKIDVELSKLFSDGVVGNRLSYNEFLQKTAVIIRKIVSRKVQEKDVEDVVQEVLISIHKASHTFDCSRPIIPWLVAIAKFRVTDYLRKLYSNQTLKTLNLDDFGDIFEDVTEQPCANEYNIEEYLVNTPDREKKILTYMYMEGYTAKETGFKIGISESAVKVAAHRAIKKIREKFTL